MSNTAKEGPGRPRHRLYDRYGQNIPLIRIPNTDRRGVGARGEKGKEGEGPGPQSAGLDWFLNPPTINIQLLRCREVVNCSLVVMESRHSAADYSREKQYSSSTLVCVC